MILSSHDSVCHRRSRSPISPRPINQPRPLRIERTDAIIRPLADDAVVLLVHRFNHRARAAADAVLAIGLAFGGPADTVMHDGVVIVGQAADNPICLRYPIVIRRTTGLDVLIMDGDTLVSVPALVLVKEAKDMAEFVGRHPFPLAPPEGGDVDVGANAFLEPDQAGVVAGVGVAREVDVFHLRRARNEGYPRAGV